MEEVDQPPNQLLKEQHHRHLRVPKEFDVLCTSGLAGHPDW
jgi:hypothetical protein